MNIKLIAFDLDGTVLNDDHLTISCRTLNALNKAYNKGIYIVPATGRLPAMIPESVRSIAGVRYIVGANGAVVFDQTENKILYENYFSESTALNILRVLKENDVPAHIYSGRHSYLDSRSAQKLLAHASDLPSGLRKAIQQQIVVDHLPEKVKEGLHVCKLNLPLLTAEMRTKLWSVFSEMPEVSVTSSLPGNIELNSKHVNKGVGLAHLCRLLTISPEQILSLGDAENDIEMLQLAGIGAAMGNAPANVKAIADYVTLDNQHDGAARAIERFALG